jgi:hypothetical protein
MPTTPTDYANDHVTTLRSSMTSKTQNSGLTGNPLEHNKQTAPDVLWQITGPQILRFSKGSYVEYIYSPSASVDSTTGVVTWPASTTVTRDITWKDGASITQLTTGVKKWTAGTKIELVWAANQAENTAFKDTANTFSAKQTFSVPPRFAVYATFADLPAGGNGDGGAYVTADGVFYDYIGGAWSQRATGTTANGSTTVAGKYEEATVAEQGSATATGGTGARLIPAVANLVSTSAGAGDANKIALLDNNGTHPVANGGSGRGTATAYGVIIGGTSATGAHQSVGVGTANQVLTSNGPGAAPTMQDARAYSKPMLVSGTDSTTLTNPTSITAFDTHTITIAANDLVAGVCYEFEAVIRFVWVTGTVKFDAQLGGTSLYGSEISFTPNATGNICIRGAIYGTTVAGPAASVKKDMYYATTNIGGTPFALTPVDVAASNFATNGTLVLRFAGYFGTSNGGHSMKCVSSKITKHSSTAF